MTNYVKGVDVAYPYQGDSYDTTALGFVFVKATQGNHYVNAHQALQINQGTKHGLVPGVYLFLEAGSDAKAQADFFYQHAIVEPGTLIALDWEVYKGQWPTNQAKNDLLKTLKKLYPKNKVGLYTNVDGWVHHDTDSYCGDFLWIASPGTAGKPNIKHAWNFHQYAVKNNVDQNVSAFATVAELKTWAGFPVVKPNVDGYQQEPGYDNWAYRQPTDGPSAWDRLRHVEELVTTLESKVDALTKAVNALVTKVTGTK